MITARLAGFVTRVLGLAIDLAILNVTTLAIGGAIAWVGSVLGVTIDAETPVIATLAAAGWLLLVSVYLVGFWSLTGQTPGMRFMGIHVTDRRGATPGLERSLRRLAGFYLAALPFGAGFLLVLIDDQRRGLHDRLARTLVIHDIVHPVGMMPDASRNGSMAEHGPTTAKDPAMSLLHRHAKDSPQEPAPAPPAAPAPAAPPSPDELDPIIALTKLKDQLDAGAITQDEFAARKQRLVPGS